MKSKADELNAVKRREVMKQVGTAALVGSAALLMGQKAEAQTLAQASWIHGTSVQVETPSLVTVYRRGGGTQIVGNSGTAYQWFHFAIPTPLIISGARRRIKSVALSFTAAGATVTEVHVYDGAKKIASYSGLSLTGTQSFRPFDVPGTPEVFRGLGISIKVGFGIDGRSIEFVSAGGDFF